MESIQNTPNRIFPVPPDREQKKSLAAALAAGFVYSAMLVGTPFLVSVILYSAEKGTILGIRYNLGILTAVLLAWSAATMLLYLLNRKAINDFVLSSKLRIEEKAVRHILGREKSASKAANVINNDIPALCGDYYRNIFKVLNSASFIVCGLVYSAFVSLYALAVELAFLLLALSIHLLFRKRITADCDRYRECRRKSISGITSFINGKLTIRSNNAYDYAESSVGRLVRDKAGAEYTYLLRKRISNSLIISTPVMATLFSSLLFALLITRGALDRKAALAAAYVVGYIIWELIKTVPVLNDFSGVRTIREYVARVAAEGETPEEGIPAPTGGIDRISLKGVTVSVPEKVLLRDVNLDLDMRGKTLVIGNSGSGKTTLLHAVMGIADYTGSISDGTEAGDSFRGFVSYLPQAVEVFPGTAAANIAIREEIPEEAVRAAAGLANYGNLDPEQEIDPFSESFSGGELKKIAFARALFHRDEKPFLLLDEPFEGLDRESRDVIQREILAHDGPAVITSHILDTGFAARCDRILVIEDGAVAWSGRFGEIPAALRQHYFAQDETEERDPA